MNVFKKTLTLVILLVVMSSPVLAANDHQENDYHGHPKVPAGIPSTVKNGMVNSYSTNWAGYDVVTSTGEVTSVKGSWIVPAVNSKVGNSYSANWIGIDGDTSSTVEQVGTSSDNPSKNTASYYAWFEFYPEPCYKIDTIQVKPGDLMSAEIKFEDGVCYANITDKTTGQSYSAKHADTGYEKKSAEWIVEAPWFNRILPLANFGTTSFGSDYTFIDSTCSAAINGVSGNISSYGSSVNSITMVNNKGQVKAQPSALSSSGTSFNVAWKRAS
ncbi:MULTISPECIES: G1 family glutamic endopeptidase [Methanosarcina]|uniref:Peptidase A4 family protein n=1 Tax=Methanosarcina vacuolata Z-761 TaxID=1434123 RepID=A0A0E3Q650_9EURY|nr:MULTISPECIES: G1 family glutamic endopeptidase [Methanosarcina]AKB44257.1 Peptidase A4 family protein [Methanosarcina vacuolata Z-761]AKB47749.1 Peptidase A4 family protein [Methanosarcina sp. Kolksee]